MTVKAVLRSGAVVRLAARHGASPQEVVRGLTANTLTGSAVPLAAATVELDDGREVAYGEIKRFVT